MGFCKPGDPCFEALGGFSLQRILDYQNEGRAKAEACGIDTSSLDFCTQINNCITGSSIHTSLTACTIWTDMIVPCETGTTINGLLQVTGAISAQTDAYVHGHIYSGTTNLLDIFCAKPCGSGGGAVSGGYWSANTAGGISNSGGTRVGINTSSPNRTLTVVGSISGTSNLDVGETLTVTGATRLHSSLRMTNGQYFYPDDGNNQTFILGQQDDLYIAADDDLFLAPDDDLQIWVGASAYAQFDGGTTSLNVGLGATPTARIQSSGALAASNSIKKIDGEDECTLLTNFYHGLSTTVEGASVFISEEQESGTGNFYLYSGPSAGGETPALDMDLILGAYQSRAACPREMIRLDGSSLLVGINNARPTRQLDVTGGIKGTTVEAGTISATTEFRIHTGNPAGGATVSPNIYWFANCDTQTVGPASDGSLPSTNTTDVSWSETHNSHAGVYSFSAEELTIKRAGLYKFTYNVTLEGGADGTTSNRTGGVIGLLQDTGGGYSVVQGTKSYVYCRIANIEKNTGSVSVIYNVTANETFKIVFARTGAQSASSKLGTVTAGTAWTVEAVT